MKLRVLITTGALLAGMLAVPTPASAAALSSVSFATSKASPSDTAVRYSWTFTTTTTATVSSVTFSVPAGTTGTPVVADYLGIGAGTVAMSGTTITYSVTTPASIASGTPIFISVDGMTNTSTPGTYTSDVSTGTDGPTTSANSVTFANNNTNLTVIVNRTLGFGSSASNLTLDLDPTNSATADRSTTGSTLTVATNATLGYSLVAKATALAGPSGQSLATVTSNPTTGVASGSFPDNAWGIALSTPTNGGSGTLSRSGALASSQYVGLPTTNATIASNTGPTNGDTIPMTLRAKVSELQAAATYGSVITYTASPSY